MALLPILCYPDNRLYLKAQKVTLFDNKLKQLVMDMTETMYHNHGIGLAANQVNVLLRLFIMDLAKEHQSSQLMVIINPQITNKEGETICEEGCLSVPGIYEKVKRANKITLEYQDLSGAKQQLITEGLTAVCIQHETDHLDGKVFVDYLSLLKQNVIKRKMKKLTH